MTTLFKTAYLLLTFLSFNCFLARTPILPYLSAVLACLGAGILLYRLIHVGRYVKTRYLLLLCLFLVSAGLSLVLNRRYGFGDGFEGLIWMVLQYFILYAADYSSSPRQHRRGFCVFAASAVILTSLYNIVGFVMLFSRYEYKRLLGDVWTYGGLHWGRLWGLYTDPNFGAVISCAALLLAVFLAGQTKRRALRVLLYLSAVLQGVYVGFTDSRTGLVCLTAAVFLLCWLFCRQNRRISGARWVRSVVGLLLAAVLAGGVAAGQKGVVYGYNKLCVLLHSSSETPSGHSPAVPAPGVIQREDETVTEGNVSNGRFEIWKNGLEIVKRVPLTGTSFRNLSSYVNANMPELYQFTGKTWEFHSMHNDFYDVLIGQGLFGFAVFLSFAAACVIFLLKRFFRLTGEAPYRALAVMLTALACMVLGMCFVSSVVFINSPVAVLFWTILGETMYVFHRETACREEKNIQTGILTEHRARNYGSCLQTIAMKQLLEEENGAVRVVDYRPRFIEDSFGLFIRDLYRKAAGNPKAVAVFFAKTLLRLPFALVREIRFYRFREKNMALTFDFFEDGQEERMKALPFRYYFLGSDQIWNPHITNGLCPYYFGGGLTPGAYKASYAASIGIGSLTGWEEDFREKLQYPDRISVREEEAVDLIRPLTEKEVCVVPDPTLAVERDFWLRFTGEPRRKKPYILVYALEENEALVSAASRLAKEKGLPLVFFDMKNRYGVKVISKYAADPRKFLNLLRGADYVITNSFHGTVFSILFRKQFLCIPHKTAPGRMTDLLDKTGLSRRLYGPGEERDLVSSMDEAADFDTAFQRLDDMREQARQYIRDVLETGEHEPI